MLIDKLLLTGIGILSVLFIVYIFFFYFKIFFVRKKIGVQVILGISTLIIWQLNNPVSVSLLSGDRKPQIRF